MRRKSPSQTLVERDVIVRLRPNGELKLVVVADTHGMPHASSARWIAAEKPDAILHAGDIGNVAVLDGLRQIAPLIAVRGNIDARGPGIADAITVDVQAGDVSVLKLLLLHIGLNGPRIRADVARLARARGARVVLCGHSHIPFIGEEGGLTVFNPGSVGPRRFSLPIVFGVMEIADGALRMRHVDSETGSAWIPAGP